MIEAAQMRQMGLRKIVLDGLVERTLLVRDAERLGLTVADDDLDNELVAGRVHVSLPVDRAAQLAYPLRLTDDLVRVLNFNNPETKAFDYKTYDRLVRQFSNRSPTEFKVMQRAELLAARLRELVKQRARISDAKHSTRTSTRSPRRPSASSGSGAAGSRTMRSISRRKRWMPGPSSTKKS